MPACVELEQVLKKRATAERADSILSTFLIEGSENLVRLGCVKIDIMWKSICRLLLDWYLYVFCTSRVLQVVERQ